MAINTYRFWMATDANRLLANQNAFIQASAPSFYQGNVAQLELHIVASAGVGTSPVEVPFPAGAAISVAVGDTNTYPTGGTWSLMVDTTQTEFVPYNATTAQVSAALNALTEVSSEGGLTVSKTGDGYSITWNTYGLKPSIGIGSDTLTPSSYESISLVQEGSAEHRQIVFVELRQNPIALGVVWTALPTPSVTVSEIQAWNGNNRIWRVGIDPQPKAGTITISYGNKTATLAYSASTALIASALSPAQVFATGQYQWDIVIAEDSVLTAFGSLVGYNGFSGSINFATAECHQFLAGAERRATVLEVSVSVDSKRYTLIQTLCNVFADVVSDGVLVPLPLGTAMSEQVANARFVRRDIDQNPNSVTQDIIWQNLGVETLGSDVVGALNQADSPSAANPFATIFDLAGLGATWGNITGTLSDQTDLQGVLNNKLPLTGGTITGDVTFDDGASGFQVIIGSNGLDFTGLAFEQSIIVDESRIAGFNIELPPASAGIGYIQFGDLTTQTTAATSFDPTGYATEAWVQSAGFTTEAWVQSQGYLTSVPPPTLTSLTGDISWDTNTSTGRLLIAGGNSPDAMFFSARLNIGDFTPNQPEDGDFWRASNKFQYSAGGVQTIASESYVNGQGFITSSALAPYAPLAGATFTGKVTMAAPTASRASLNLGVGVSPTTSVAGDIWIATNFNYKDSFGTQKVVANTNTINTFTSNQYVNCTSTFAALRVTQLGTGNALEVEDSAFPDATRFVVDQFGKVGIGVAPDASAALKVDDSGIRFNNQAVLNSIESPLGNVGATYDMEIPVTINGVNYKISCRQV